jgi:hypothetical protein
MTCPRRLPAIAQFMVLTLVAIASCGKEPLGSNNPDGGSGGASVGGSGGAHGSGGVAGSGGASGSGGSSGAGGTKTPADGSSDTGGAGGKEAPVGADGAVDRPASADGPSSSDASADCNGLIAEYEAAFKEAKKCDPTQEAVHCQPMASPSLPCPGCQTHVQITTALDAIRARWDKASCRGPMLICPTIKCVNPGTGVCTASAGGGVCTDSPAP